VDRVLRQSGAGVDEDYLGEGAIELLEDVIVGAVAVEYRGVDPIAATEEVDPRAAI